MNPPPELILPTIVILLAVVWWLYVRLRRRLNEVPVEPPRVLTEAEEEAWKQIVGQWRQDPELRWPTNPRSEKEEL